MKTFKDILFIFLILILLGICAGFVKKKQDYYQLKVEHDSLKAYVTAIHAKDSLALLSCEETRDSLKVVNWNLSHDKWALEQRVKRIEKELKQCKRHKWHKIKYKHSRVTYTPLPPDQ